MRQRGRDRWVSVTGAAAAALVFLVVAEPALAEKKPARRVRPGGGQARVLPRGQTTPAADVRLEAAVARLRSALDQAPAAGPAAARREAGEAPYVGRTASGHVRALMAPPGRSFRPSRSGAAGDPESLALSFLRENRVAFGWSGARASLRGAGVRSRQGRSFVRLEQRLAGLPVFGAAAVVQVEDSGGIAFALADLARDGARMYQADFPTSPSVGGQEARDLARAAIPAARRAADLQADTPELMVFEPRVVGSAGPSRLVWHVRVQGGAGAVDEVVLVDAEEAGIAFQYSQIMHAKDRSIYDHDNVEGSPGTLARSEGGAATGLPAVDRAYDFLGDTYDFYSSRFGRDSYDGAGAELVARVRYCPVGDCPYPNAFWSPSAEQMFFGDGYEAADDVVAHELTHAVTDRTSQLIYWGESGAINESLSDIFGEFVDLTNTNLPADPPGDRWLLGEDLPIGAVRNMADPTVHGDPDRRLSLLWYTGSDDNRGVHINSGVGNKLAFLLTDGGTFNGQTVAGQGVTNVAALFYEANADLLVPASDYFDLYAVLRQAARNLGWSGAAQVELELACRAVEIAVPGNATTIFQDGFEGAFPGAWDVDDAGGVGDPPPGIGTEWGRSTHRASTGAASAYCAAGGPTPAPAGGPYPSFMSTWLVYGPFSLADATAAWVEFDLLLDVEPGFDDIFWGISTDNVTFDGYAVSPLPDGFTLPVGGEGTWVPELFNFKEITSPSVVGEPQVWLGFNFFSDEVIEYEGAYLDNVSIRTATAAAPFGVFDSPAEGAGGLSGTVTLSGWALDDLEVTRLEIRRSPGPGETPDPDGQVAVGDAAFAVGLRPDVEAAFPTYPFSNRAGWTLGFPSGLLPGGGNGAFTFSAYAYDADARITLLGTGSLGFANNPTALPAPVITSPSPSQVFPVPPATFTWQTVAGPDRYHVRVTTRPGGTTVHSAGVLGPSATTTNVSLADGAYDVAIRACAGGIADAQCGAFATRSFDVGHIAPVWHNFFAVDTRETPYVGDFDGDGRTDIITFTRDNPLAFGDVYVSLSTGSAFEPFSTKWHDFFAIRRDEQVVIGDYDGDGKDDIGTWLGATTRQVYVALSFGTGMAPAAIWLDEIGFDPSDVLLAGDADGDGREDLVLFARTIGKVYVALSTGAGFAAPTQWHGFFAVSTFERPQVGDLNGDGKTDIITFATDSPTAFGDVYVAVSDGTKFGDGSNSVKWHDFFAIRPTETVRIGDLDDDGRDDFFTFLPPPFAQCYTTLSLGTAMGANALWPESVAPLATDVPYVGDANGDGKADLIVFSQSEGKVYVSLAP